MKEIIEQKFNDLFKQGKELDGRLLSSRHIGGHRMAERKYRNPHPAMWVSIYV